MEKGIPVFDWKKSEVVSPNQLKQHPAKSFSSFNKLISYISLMFDPITILMPGIWLDHRFQTRWSLDIYGWLLKSLMSYNTI